MFVCKKGAVGQGGLLSTDYFLYWEDVDWCFRVRQLGYRLAYVPSAIVWHKVVLLQARYRQKI